MPIGPAGVFVWLAGGFFRIKRAIIAVRFLMLNWRDPKNPLTGGAERASMAHLSALARRGHEVFWFANGFPNCLPEETIEGVRIVRGGGKGSSVFKAIKWYR